MLLMHKENTHFLTIALHTVRLASLGPFRWHFFIYHFLAVFFCLQMFEFRWDPVFHEFQIFSQHHMGFFCDPFDLFFDGNPHHETRCVVSVVVSVKL